MFQITDIQQLIKFIEQLKNDGKVYNDTDFCQKVGIPKSYLSEFRAGRKQLKEQNVRKIRDAFPEYFVEKEEQPATNDLGALISLARENNRRCHDQIDRLITILEYKEGVVAEQKEKSA